jgi:alkaline phosphatase D
MANTLHRRCALQALAGAGAAAAAASTAVAQTGALNPAPYSDGVASGDPQADCVVLWTRLATPAPRMRVAWAVAEDEGFRRIVRRGSAFAAASADHTVKAIADRLQPGRRYSYRFIAGGAASPISRTKTLPVGRVEKRGVAFVSCSNYPFGFFNAYGAIA